MLSEQLRQVGVTRTLIVVVAAAVITYLGLHELTASGHEGKPVHIVAATLPAATPASTSHHQDGSTSPTQHNHTPATTAAAKPKAPVTSTVLKRAAGQMIVTGFTGLTPSPRLLQRVRAGQVGGVIFMGQNISTIPQVQQATHDLQAAATAGGNPWLLIMTDQEGGTVKRFPSAHPTQSAEQMGKSPTGIREQGRLTGVDLLQRGVNVDLAPVADVRHTADNFLTTRTFGTDPAEVAVDACAFSHGLRAAGVGATLKHFPGLGWADAANTDNGPVSIPAAMARLQRDWAPYRACHAGKRTMVMISNAAYPALTGDDTPAVLSPIVYGTLRQVVGFTGPTITDALGHAVSGDPKAAVTVAAAGADLLLYTDEQASRHAHHELLVALADHTLDAAKVRAAAQLIHTYKAALAH